MLGRGPALAHRPEAAKVPVAHHRYLDGLSYPRHAGYMPSRKSIPKRSYNRPTNAIPTFCHMLRLC